MRRKRGWVPYRIVEIQDETHDTKTFYFRDADDDTVSFDYLPGQYLTFRYDHAAAKPVVRSYTMSSSPCENQAFAVTVKRVDRGIVSNWMCDQLKAGDVLKARGPMGRFCPDPHTDRPHLVMVAAGSGVTPFTSILREAALRPAGDGRRYTLLVSFRSRDDLINWTTLQSAAEKPGIQVITTLSRDEAPGFLTGRPNQEMVRSILGANPDEVTVMTCGPTALMEMVVQTAREAGVHDEQIKLESFES